MTLTTIIARFKGSIGKTAEAPDFFDARLQKLSNAKMREIRVTQSVFKTRHQRLEA